MQQVSGKVKCVFTFMGLAKFFNIACGRVPKVHAATQRNGEDVGRRPIQHVQIVVVNEVGRIENTLRSAANVSVALNLRKKRTFDKCLSTGRLKDKLETQEQ